MVEDSGLNLKEFSSKIGVSYRTIQNYLTGNRGIGSDFLSAMTTQMRVSASWVLTGEGDMYLSEVSCHDSVKGDVYATILRYSARKEPVFDTSFAGGTMDETHYAFRRDWLEKRGLNPNDCHVLRVKGDGMVPIMRDGDLAVIDRNQTQPIDGKLYVVVLNDTPVIRMIRIETPDKLVAHCANKVYPPSQVPPSDIAGRVVATMGEW